MVYAIIVATLTLSLGMAIASMTIEQLKNVSAVKNNTVGFYLADMVLFCSPKEDRVDKIMDNCKIDDAPSTPTCAPVLFIVVNSGFSLSSDKYFKYDDGNAIKFVAVNIGCTNTKNNGDTLFFRWIPEG